MKLLGAVLLICACTLLGIGQARRLNFRRSCLSAAMDALRYIEAELKNGSVPMPEIFMQLATQSNSKFQVLFKKLSEKMCELGEASLSEIWSDCILNEQSISLSDEQRQELCKLGNYLGRYSETEQSEAISACIGHLSEELRMSSEKAREGTKLYTGLGLTFGLMLAAVLI